MKTALLFRRLKSITCSLCFLCIPFALGQSRPESQAMDAAEQRLSANSNDTKASLDEVDTAIHSALTAKRSGDNELALAYLLRANYWAKNNPDLLLDTAIQEQAMGLYQDADSALTKAAQLRPDDPRTLYATARLKMDLNQPAASEVAWKAYLTQNPTDASAHYGYGVLLQMLQRSDEAVKQFEASIHLQPKQAESYYRLGEMAREKGNADTAKAQYMKALEQDGKHAGALAGLGILAYQQASYADAGEYLKQAVLIAPELQSAHYYYGLTLKKLGQMDASRKELDLAVQLTNEENSRRTQSHRLAAEPYHP